MKLRSTALACSLSLFVAACGGESQVEVPASNSSEPAVAEATEADVATAEPAAVIDDGLTIAERQQQALVQKRLDAKAEKEKQLAARAQNDAIKGGQLTKTDGAGSTQKSAQKTDGYGLTEEQNRKRQAILDNKAAINARGGKPTGGYDGPAGEGPRISLKRKEINFGEVWDTDTMNGSFEFTNTGKSKLVISLVKASCGCTSTELEKMEFEPGEGSKIDVEWHPKGFGPQIKTVTITSNNEDELYTRLMIRANIKPFAKWDPEPTRFNNVRIFEEHKTQAVLTCVDPAFEVLDLKTSNPNLTAIELERRANGDRVFELTLGDQTPWGMFNATVIAKVKGLRTVTNEEGVDVQEMQERDAILHVGASVFGDLEVTPNLFSVGRVVPKGKVNFSVVLKSTEGKDFKLTTAVVENSQPPGMTLRSEPNPGGGIRVFVEGDVGDYEGLIRGTAVMETDLEGEGPRRLPIMGIVRR
jgi:Protein of unknown function (DUF1573)